MQKLPTMAAIETAIALVLIGSAATSPVAQPLLFTSVRSVPDLVKRVDLVPSQYSYGVKSQARNVEIPLPISSLCV